MAGRVAPTGKRQSGCLVLLFRISVGEKAVTSDAVVLLRLSVGGAAMFAEPTVTEIEKVVCLIHEYQRSEVGSRKSEVGDQKSEVRGKKSEVGNQRSEVSLETFVTDP